MWGTEKQEQNCDSLRKEGWAGNSNGQTTSVSSILPKLHYLFPMYFPVFLGSDFIFTTLGINTNSYLSWSELT